MKNHREKQYSIRRWILLKYEGLSTRQVPCLVNRTYLDIIVIGAKIIHAGGSISTNKPTPFCVPQWILFQDFLTLVLFSVFNFVEATTPQSKVPLPVRMSNRCTSLTAPVCPVMSPLVCFIRTARNGSDSAVKTLTAKWWVSDSRNSRTPSGEYLLPWKMSLGVLRTSPAFYASWSEAQWHRGKWHT